jgi:hypothetical protein
MKRINQLFILLVVFFSLTLTVPVQAQQPTPQASTELPTPPAEFQPAIQLDAFQSELVQPETLSLPTLKAVLMVGAIDGDNGPGTTAEVNYMKLAATVLRNNGVQVIEFYPPNADWQQILSAVNGAHFVLYRGHGIYNGDSQHPTSVGGMKMGSIIYTNDMILRDFNPAPNAIYMLYGCYTAGSSGNDRFSISSSEAQSRIVQYAQPYFEMGAAGYYSNWFGDGYAKILEKLFQGYTLSAAYTSYPDYNPARSEQYPLPNQAGKTLWMDKDYWSPYPVPTPQYDHAFAGLANATLTDLFVQEMKLSSNSISLMVQTGYSSIQQAIQVTSQPAKSFPWSASITFQQGGSGWATLSATSGASPNGFTVQIPSGKPTGTYRATIQVASSDTGLRNNPQTIAVTLVVVPQLRQVFLPSLRR